MHTDSQLRTLRMIERDIKCSFERVDPPAPEDVLQASSLQTVDVLSRVHPEVTEVFLETAQKLLAEKGPHALAAALAHISGFTQPPSGKSLITYETVSLSIPIRKGPCPNAATWPFLSGLYHGALDSRPL